MTQDILKNLSNALSIIEKTFWIYYSNWKLYKEEDWEMVEYILHWWEYVSIKDIEKEKEESEAYLQDEEDKMSNIQG